MGYVEKNLVPGESILHRARYHWIFYRTGLLLLFFAVLLVVAAVYAGRTAPDGEPLARILRWTALVFFVLSILDALARWIQASRDEFVVTNRRVIRKVGVLAREVEQAPIEKIQDITVEQSWFGRLLNFGTVTLETASERGTLTFPRISRPEAFRNALWGQAVVASPGSSSASGSEGPDVSFQGRLAELENLRGRGLVSEEEYASKRREILSSL